MPHLSCAGHSKVAWLLAVGRHSDGRMWGPPLLFCALGLPGRGHFCAQMPWPGPALSLGHFASCSEATIWGCPGLLCWALSMPRMMPGGQALPKHSSRRDGSCSLGALQHVSPEEQILFFWVLRSLPHWSWAVCSLCRCKWSPSKGLSLHTSIIFTMA